MDLFNLSAAGAALKHMALSAGMASWNAKLLGMQFDSAPSHRRQQKKADPKRKAKRKLQKKARRAQRRK